MISAATGGTLKVIGSSMAIVASGPMPGSTPIRVPRNTPMKQYHRFWRVRATVKPNTRLLKSSILVAPQSLDERIRQTQSLDEHEHGEDGQADGQQGDLDDLELPSREGRERYQCQHRGNEAG